MARRQSGKRRQTGGDTTGSFGADPAYEAIRASRTDIEDIARTTGYKAQNIRKVKLHLFEEAHLLDRYEHLGVPSELRRFDSDPRISAFWRRLELGVFLTSDLQLLRHEIAEAWYMRRHGPSYAAAHEAAQARFPSPLG